MKRANWRPRWSVIAALPVALGVVVASCDAPRPTEPDLGLFFQHLCDMECAPEEGGGHDGGGGGGGSGVGADTSYDYGTYLHTYSDVSMSSTDTDVNSYQNAAFSEDTTAFLESSRDWSNPDAENVAAWPVAMRVAAGVAQAVQAGRALAQTTSFRQAVSAGARWAANVTASVAAAMLVGRWPFSPEATPVADFDFMFDYGSR